MVRRLNNITWIGVCLVFLICGGHTISQAEELPDNIRVVFRNPAGVFVKDGKTGLEGFDIELLDRYFAWYKNLSGRMVSHKPIEVKTVSDLLKSVKTKKCDLAIGSITATKERAEFVDFSKPYLPVRMVLFSKKDRLSKGPYQKTLVGKTVGAIISSTGAKRITQLTKEVPTLMTKTYPDYNTLFQALLNPAPEIDAVVTDVTHYWVLSGKEDLVLMGPMSPEQGLGLVFPKGSRLRASVDAFLADFLHSHSYYSLVRRHFGQEAAKLIKFARQ